MLSTNTLFKANVNCFKIITVLLLKYCASSTTLSSGSESQWDFSVCVWVSRIWLCQCGCTQTTTNFPTTTCFLSVCTILSDSFSFCLCRSVCCSFSLFNTHTDRNNWDKETLEDERQEIVTLFPLSFPSFTLSLSKSFQDVLSLVAICRRFQQTVYMCVGVSQTEIFLFKYRRGLNVVFHTPANFSHDQWLHTQLLESICPFHTHSNTHTHTELSPHFFSGSL